MVQNNISANGFTKLSHDLATRDTGRVYFESTVMGLIIFFTVSGNTFVCCAIWRNPRLRTISNMFVVALAVSDTSMGVLCMPFTFGTLVSGGWVFGKSFCYVHGFTGMTLALASIYTMSLISVNRYFCIVKPAKYQELFKKRRTVLYILGVWTIAFIGSIPPFFLDDEGYGFQPGKAMCLYKFETNLTFTIFIECVYIACPILLIGYCYSSVFREVYRTNKVFAPNPQSTDQLRAHIQETKITKTLAIVFLGFSLCWVPASIIDTLGSFSGEPPFERPVYLAYTYLAMISSLINPVIYGVTSRAFRQEYKAMFKMIISCGRASSNPGHSGQESQLES
ncbi:predicted protein [Nematostella vectensis]|uniref:G-protein coupled receptors family 1 profile domain-containing protein n=1 Tax=Nematostella vectensis TaxID=45351 RepID=A7RSP6_NEMVE|nr:melatonin-related receptor [Nematostella vectensis]EDO45454.1 predicted protein [Nematostella vectensis]|eukprot:XP_001637517.1 predicted protein [Nematostella vectensis]